MYMLCSFRLQNLSLPLSLSFSQTHICVTIHASLTLPMLLRIFILGFVNRFIDNVQIIIIGQLIIFANGFLTTTTAISIPIQQHKILSSVSQFCLNATISESLRPDHVIFSFFFLFIYIICLLHRSSFVVSTLNVVCDYDCECECGLEVQVCSFVNTEGVAIFPISKSACVCNVLCRI